MAAIVNARDVQLQATSPRLLGVTIGGNVSVPQGNVTGLGLVVEGTKQIFIQASSQIFQIPKSGSTSPSSITLTAVVRNITATPTLTIAPGGGTMSVTPALNGSLQFTFTEAQMTTDTVTLKISATEGGNTYTDTMTFVKVREGIDSLNGFLTNENITMAADYLGNILSWTGASGNFKVYQGINDVTGACTFSIPAGGNPDSITGSINGTTGAYSFTGNWPSAKDQTTITLRATFGSINLDKVFTLSRAKAGTNGATAQNLALTYTAQTFTYDGPVGTNAPVANPSSQTITFTAQLQNLSGTVAWTATGYDASGTSLGAISMSGTGAQRTMTNSQFLAVGSTVAYAVVTASLGGLTDQTTIVKLVAGSNQIQGYLTNGAATVATASDGTGGTYSGAGGTFKVFSGTTDVTTSATFSVVSSGNLTISINSTTGVYTVTNCTTDTSSATLRAVYAGKTIDLVYSFAKSKAGTNGSNGSNGQRGSQTFYVNIAGSTWSDATATSAASASGGPIVNDIVCEYNNSANFSVSKFWSGSAWVTINAVIDGNLLVTGTVGASKINSTGLDIKDSLGNTILSAAMIPGADDSSSLDFNPTFSSWTGTYPDNWVTWTGAAPTRVLASGINATYAVQWTTSASTNQGMYCLYDFTAPIPAGAFLSGTFLMNMVTNNGGGAPGYLVRLYTNAAHTTFVDTKVNIPDQTQTGWQKIQWTAGAGGAPIYRIHIYQMASWSSMPGGYAAAGNVVQYGPMSFVINDPITASNVATRIGTAAIGNAYIGNYIASADWDGTVTSNGVVTTPGTQGWIIAKGVGGTSKMEMDAANIRGTLTTNQIAVGAVTAVVINDVLTSNYTWPASTSAWDPAPSGSPVHSVTFTAASNGFVTVMHQADLDFFLGSITGWPSKYVCDLRLDIFDLTAGGGSFNSVTRFVRCAGAQQGTNSSEAIVNVASSLSLTGGTLISGHSYKVTVTVTGVQAFTTSGTACLGSGTTAFGIYNSKLTVLQNKV